MRNIGQFLREVREELRKVVWPTRQQTTRYTVIVIAISLTVGVYLSILDSLFGRIVSTLLG